MKLPPLRRRGFVVWAWLLIVVMIGSLVFGLRLLNRRLTDTRQCREQLLRIYSAFELYEFSEGRLPDLDFYPNSPLTGSQSIVTALAKYGLHPSDCVCPAGGHSLREAGLSYLWNPRLSGRPLGSFRQPEWMLVEIQAMNPKLAPPHLGHYHILYTDGAVRSELSIPHDIPVRPR
jgi:hypothetical protein